MQKPSFRNTWLPLILALVALVILNVGLYTRLASQPAPPSFDFPYSEDFATLNNVPYEEFGGDWEIRDEQLVQLSTSGFDLSAFIPLEIPAEQPYSFDATMRYLGGSMGGGLLFNAQQVTSRQKSHMARFNVDGGQLWLIYGYFGDDSDFIGQGSVQLDIAPSNDVPTRMGVAVKADTYDIFLDDAQVAADIPLIYRGGAAGFISATSQVAFDDVRVAAPIETVAEGEVEEPAAVEPSVEIADADGSLVFGDSFDAADGGESLWKPLSGEWVFADGTLMQQQTGAFDLSNIYHRTFAYPIQMTTTFEHVEGAGAGLLFNLEDPNLKNGGQMVRYVEDGTYLTWGNFDEAGLYQGVGSSPVPMPGTGSHTLTVIADGETFSVILDDEVLVVDEPIAAPVANGHIGLTASQSVVAFNDIQITRSDVLPVTASPARIDAEAATGTWISEGGVITQAATEKTDYIAGTGLAGEQFTVSVDIALPDDVDDAGAGLVFHMGGRDDRAGGYMVRFSQGGREIFWGQYDGDDVFTGAGSIPVALSEDPTRTLLLYVRENDFDIEIDGEMAVENIPIERDSGWIGLVSFGGPVTFSNVSLELGE